MNKIKIYQLKNVQTCKFKAYVSQFNDFKTLKNKNSMIRQVYKDIILDYDFSKDTNQENLKNIILEKLDDKYFITTEEKNEEVNIILAYLIRYFTYEKQLNRKAITKQLYNSVKLNNKDIELNADIVFENKDSIELVKYKTSATKLSYKARTEKNLPENEIELYLLKQMGEKIFSEYNKPVIASFYHLKGKNEDKDVYKQFLNDRIVLEDELKDLESKQLMIIDKKEKKIIDKEIKLIKDVLYFENSQGNNIIQFGYDKDLNDKITELLDTELNIDSEKCKSSDCEFCSYSTLCNYDFNNDKEDLQVVKSVKKSNGELKLSKVQKQVMDIENGNYRINAVPGLGKSLTMVMRTIELIKKGYSLNDILLITFTNKGCQELKERINFWLDYYKIKDINKKELNIFTFNSFGEHIVSKEWEKLGFTKAPELATLIDINDIIKELLEEHEKIEWLNYKNPLLNYPNSKGAFKQLLLYFNMIKSFDYNKKVFYEEVLSKENKDKSIEDSNTVFELYEKFNQKLKDKSLLQYQDQILFLIKLLEENKELINTYGYKHLIVDEYQDSNVTQVQLLHLLNKYKDFKSLMVVGDSSQSIYSFNNTTPENIINFHKEFDNVKDVFLLDNYRSTPQICSVANKLDKLNTERIDKEIVSKREDGKTPQLLKFKKLDDEYNYITNLIEEKINEGISKHEICCIARTKKELLEIQTYLNNKNIPNVLDVSELYIDNPNVQLIINLANFFKNNEYDYYLMEYVFATSDEIISDNTIIKDVVTNVKTKIIEEFDIMDTEEIKLKYFKALITPIIEKDIIAKTFIENIYNKTFYSFNEFLNYLYKVRLYKDDTSIQRDENKYDCITLTTGHSSKGKEWKIVINSINNYKYEDIKDNIKLLEEERRLLFVSITRAKDELYVTYNTHEDKTRNKGKYTGFIDELEDVEKVEI